MNAHVLNGLNWVAVAMAGACMGSFIHVLGLRWAEVLNGQPGASLWRAMVGRSACVHCGHVLKAPHMVPVLSWLALKGRCAVCRYPIGVRDLLAELLLGLAWLLLYLHWGWGWSLLVWWAWASVLLLLSLIDLDTFLLPDELTLGLVASGVLAAWLGLTQQTWMGAVLGAAVGYGLLALVALAYKWWRGKEGMGMGDAKLLAALGAWLGPWPLPVLLWLSALIGVVWGLVLQRRARLRADGAFPFGPALALAGLWVSVWPVWLGA